MSAASLRIEGRTSAELVIAPDDTLTWQVTLENTDGAWQVLVDAMSGKVLDSVQVLPAR